MLPIVVSIAVTNQLIPSIVAPHARAAIDLHADWRGGLPGGGASRGGAAACIGVREIAPAAATLVAMRPIAPWRFFAGFDVREERLSYAVGGSDKAKAVGEVIITN